MSKSTPIFIKFSLVAIVVALVVGYIFFNSILFIRGPQLSIDSPFSGALVDNRLTKISGNSMNTSFISINDRPISVDDRGNFSEEVLLHDGYNVITIEAKDKFDRQVTKQLDLVYNMEVDNS